MPIYYKFNAQVKKYDVPSAGLELINKYNGVSKISFFSSERGTRWFQDAFFKTADRKEVLLNSSKYPENVVEYCRDPKNRKVFTVWYFDINRVMRSGCHPDKKCFKNLNKNERKNQHWMNL